MPERKRVEQLISYVQHGRILEAFDEFYDDHVEMQENRNPPTQGKVANREHERRWLDSVAKVNQCRAKTCLVDGDKSAIEWEIDYDTKDGQHMHMEEVAQQHWQDDKIVRERFFYDTAPLKQ